MEDVYVVTIADSGAMGSGGEVTLYAFEKRRDYISANTYHNDMNCF